MKTGEPYLLSFYGFAFHVRPNSHLAVLAVVTVSVNEFATEVEESFLLRQMVFHNSWV